MTHDKLLTKIESFTCCSGAHELALRAVVELHKPYTEQVAYAICTTCQCVYPCPTIQAIEKELG